MTRTETHCPECRGFSLVELLVALTIALLVTSAVFVMLDPTGGAFQTQPEVADVEQRLRASADAILRDLAAAGSGPVYAREAPEPTQLAAAVFPFRIGRRGADPIGTFDSTRIAFWYVSPAGPQATLAAPLGSASGATSITAGPGCPDRDLTCGFRAGMTVGLFGRSGEFDLFSVTAVAGNVLTLQHNLRDSAAVYPPGSTVLAEVSARTYFMSANRGLGYAQLLRYDGAGGADVPVVDHLVSLSFEYYGDAEPPTAVPGTTPVRVTYGPQPPEPGVQWTLYPLGENCAFTRTAAGGVAPRLAPLAEGQVLALMPAAALTDGPWCPDDADPNRYDADLLRVRQIVVTMRIESAVDALRGPAGPLFSRSGTARGNRLVPDRVARVAVAPRALNGGR